MPTQVLPALLVAGACASLLILVRPSVGTGSHNVTYSHKVDASNGRLLWRSTAGTDEIKSTIVWSSPALWTSYVYIGSRDGHLYAFDSVSGELKFKNPMSGYVDSSPHISHGVLFVGLSGNKSVGAFNASTGALLWVTPLAGLVDSSPAVTALDGRLVACNDDSGQTHLLDAGTGSMRWSTPVRRGQPPAFNTPTFTPNGQRIFSGVGGLAPKSDGAVYALTADSGAYQWKIVVAGDQGGFSGSVQSVPSLSPNGERLVFGSWDTHVYAVHPEDGSPQWRTPTDGRVDASARYSPDGHTLYIGSWDACLYALDAHTGARRWRTCTGGVVRSTAAVSADGTAVLVGSADGFLYCFKTSDGRVQWRVFCGKSDPAYGVRSTPLLSPDETVVYVGSADGHLYAWKTGFAAVA